MEVDDGGWRNIVDSTTGTGEINNKRISIYISHN